MYAKKTVCCEQSAIEDELLCIEQELGVRVVHHDFSLANDLLTVYVSQR